MIDPVAFCIFGLPIRWYSLAYIFGILICAFISKKYANRIGNFKPEKIDQFLNYAIIGIIIGGRLGHVLFYELNYYLDNIFEIIKIWEGGMSFHGGLIGVIFSIYIFTKRHKINFLAFCDVLSISTPIGLFLGRIANFINGELFGRQSNCVFAITALDGVSRHPSQLYEAFSEGLVAVVIMSFALQIQINKGIRTGVLSGTFCVCYAIFRYICEFFREPDTLLNYSIFGSLGITIGQILSIPMLILGIFLIFLAKNNPNKESKNI